MADLTLSEIQSSSSDESTVVQSQASGLAPFQFEPRRGSDEEKTSSDENSSSESETEAESEGKTRLQSVDWCGCGCCSTEHIQREKECVCCLEKQATAKIARESEDTGELKCVTKHKDFVILCTNPAVLRNVLVGFNNVRGDRWPVNPPNNSGFRYAAYRQFSWWIHGKLGPGRRRVIPSCATHSIRGVFPKSEEGDYTGFVSGEESDSDWD